MSYQVEGKVHKVFDTDQKTDTFKARDFVIETEGNYPQFIKFQCVQDKTSIVDGVEPGERIKVFFDLRGREWQGKFFTNLNAWKIERDGGGDEFNQERPSTDEMPMSERDDLDDDLPF